MKSDFEKVLSHCQNRIQNENVQIIQISNGNIVKASSSNAKLAHNDVRPEIQNFIKQKSEENKKVPSKDEQSDKNQILFSLKDFLDTASTSKGVSSPSPQSQNDDKDDVEEVELEEDLNEDDESLKDNSFNNRNESPKEEIDLADIDSDIEELERVDNCRIRKGEDDLESEITKLENLQRKINDNLKETPKDKDDDAKTVNETILLKMNGKSADASNISNIKSVPSIVPPPPTSSSSSSKEDKGRAADNEVMEPLKPEQTFEDRKTSSQQATSSSKSSTLPEGMFRNISISVVGGANKNVNLNNLLGGKAVSPEETQKTKPQPGSMTAPPVSSSGGTKRPQPATSSTSTFDTKRFRNSSIVITSSRPASEPSMSKAEASSKPDDTDVPEKDESSKFDICNHSNSLGYLCHDCSFNRWRTGFEFVKTRKEKVVVETVPVAVSDADDKNSNNQSDEPSKAANILKNVNWQQVFSFAGISLGQSSAEQTKAV